MESWWLTRKWNGVWKWNRKKYNARARLKSEEEAFPIGGRPETYSEDHDSSIFIQSSNPVCGSWKSQASAPVSQTAHSLTCSITEKPNTGLDDCLNMLLSCTHALEKGCLLAGLMENWTETRFTSVVKHESPCCIWWPMTQGLCGLHGHFNVMILMNKCKKNLVTSMFYEIRNFPSLTRSSWTTSIQTCSIIVAAVNRS